MRCGANRSSSTLVCSGRTDDLLHINPTRDGSRTISKQEIRWSIALASLNIWLVGLCGATGRFRIRSRSHPRSCVRSFWFYVVQHLLSGTVFRWFRSTEGWLVFRQFAPIHSVTSRVQVFGLRLDSHNVSLRHAVLVDR